MEYVYMYTVYKDLKFTNYEDDEFYFRTIQYERDKKLFELLKKHNIPIFPMKKEEFDKHTNLFRGITEENPSLCLIFKNSKNCEVLVNGVTKTYDDIDQAAKSCQDMDPCSKLTSLMNKYTL